MGAMSTHSEPASQQAPDLDLLGHGLPGVLSATGYALPPDLAFADWRDAGRRLRAMDGAIQWWVGDWLMYGERTYGGRYAEALEATDYSYKTLRNSAYVSSHVDLSRRRDMLSHSHHAEIAPLPPAEQDKWLDRAVAKRWTRAKLRDLVQKETKLNRKLVAPDGFPALTERYQLYVGDVGEAAQVADGSVDCIITDPPYAKEFLPVYGALSKTAARILKPGGSCLVMAGQSYLPEVIAGLSKHLNYHWTVSYMTPGGQAVQVWGRKAITFWKPVLWFVNGSYDSDWVGDVASEEPGWLKDVVNSDVNGNDKRFHDWGQSESGIGDLLYRFSNAGERICDPFVGGGTTAVVAVQMNRSFVGLDSDPRAIATTLGRLAALEGEDARSAA